MYLVRQEEIQAESQTPHCSSLSCIHLVMEFYGESLVFDSSIPHTYYSFFPLVNHFVFLLPKVFPGIHRSSDKSRKTTGTLCAPSKIQIPLPAPATFPLSHCTLWTYNSSLVKYHVSSTSSLNISLPSCPNESWFSCEHFFPYSSLNWEPFFPHKPLAKLYCYPKFSTPELLPGSTVVYYPI